MYESFYKLTACPFLLDADPSYYFGSKGHANAFAHLKFGIHQAQGFIVVTGEIGAGKTTLLHTLLDGLEQADVVAAHLVSTQLAADELLRSVCAGFGLPMTGESKAQHLATLEAYFTSLATEGRRALLIVDEAQNLDARALEELRMLSNYQLAHRALLQTVLVGQPELRATLRSPALQQFRQRIASSFHLGPVEPDETQRYIEHRLGQAQWSDDPHFEPATFALIHRYSGGIPRRINAICNRLLLYGYMNDKHTLLPAYVKAVVHEMSFELGLDEDPAPAPAPALAPAPGTESPGRDAAMRPFAYSAIVSRLDRLEKSLAAVLELLRGGATESDRRGRPATSTMPTVTKPVPATALKNSAIAR